MVVLRAAADETEQLIHGISPENPENRKKSNVRKREIKGAYARKTELLRLKIKKQKIAVDIGKWM
jgi:hypothetical protein